MKKLKLTAFQLGSTEILTRQQLRNVLGGDASTTTTTTTKTGTIRDPNCGSCTGNDGHLYGCYYNSLSMCMCTANGSPGFLCPNN